MSTLNLINMGHRIESQVRLGLNCGWSINENFMNTEENVDRCSDEFASPTAELKRSDY